MNYNYLLENFVSIPSTTDKRIIIYNKNGEFSYSIDPLQISHTYSRNNCFIIKIMNKNDIVLNFENSSIADAALLKFDDIRKRFSSIWCECTTGSTIVTNGLVIEFIHKYIDINGLTSSYFNISGSTTDGDLTGSTHIKIGKTAITISDLSPNFDFILNNSTYILVEKLSNKNIYGFYFISNGSYDGNYIEFNISSSSSYGFLEALEYCTIKIY